MFRAKIWEETQELKNLFEVYKSLSKDEYVLYKELERKKWDEELIEAFVTYVVWNVHPLKNIPDWKYEESKEILERYGYMTSKWI